MKYLALLCLATLTLSKKIPRMPYPDQHTLQATGYEQKNLTQLIDNFGYSEASYSMRYFIKDSYYDGKNITYPGVIFFYCGNQGPIQMFIDNSGFIDHLAQQMKALVVFAEHRYFGQSMPFGNASFTTEDNRRYLSPHQALADYAYLIRYLKTQYFDAPVIAFGGSYGGMLAAWFRMKYPNMVAGSIAASAPLYHFIGDVDYEAFYKVVTDDYAKVTPQCPTYFQQGFQILNSIKSNYTEYFKLADTFKTCTPIITADDVQLVINYVENALIYMAMTDYPYETSFLRPMPASPVTVACDTVSQYDQTGNWDLLAYVKLATDVYYNYTGDTSCSNIVTEDNGSLGQTGWDYLSCTTLNIPSQTNGKTDMFIPDIWNQQQVDAACVQQFGVAPDIFYAKVYFGSSSDHSFVLRSMTNIVFSNGDLDPWQTGAVTELTASTPDLVAFIMHQAAHHLDLRKPNAADPKEVHEGRGVESRVIQAWIDQFIVEQY